MADQPVPLSAPVPRHAPHNGASMVKLSVPGRAKSVLGFVSAAGAVDAVFTPDGFGVLLFPSSTSLSAHADPEAPKPKKGALAPIPARIAKGTCAVIECGCQIEPTKGWAIVGAYEDLDGGVAVAANPYVAKGDSSVPRFLVHAVDHDVILHEDTPIGVVGILT